MALPITSARTWRNRRTICTALSILCMLFAALAARMILSISLLRRCRGRRSRQPPGRRKIIRLHCGVSTLDGSDEPQGMVRVAGDVVGAPRWRARRRLRAEIHKNAAASGAVARLHIIEDVAHQP